MQQLKQMEVTVQAAPDQQVSLTDPDARAMATSGKGTGMVGYNVQTAVDTKHHLIVAHEVTNVGHDRGQLSNMARTGQDGDGHEALDASGRPRLLQRRGDPGLRAPAMTPYVPKPLTSGAKAEGRFGKQDFIYIAADDAYRCPAGEQPELALHIGRERDGPAPLLDDAAAQLSAESPMHDRPSSAASSAGSTRR